jgi:hypothetical protein
VDIRKYPVRRRTNRAEIPKMPRRGFRAQLNSDVLAPGPGPCAAADGSAVLFEKTMENVQTADEFLTSLRQKPFTVVDSLFA